MACHARIDCVFAVAIDFEADRPFISIDFDDDNRPVSGRMVAVAPTPPIYVVRTIAVLEEAPSVRPIPDPPFARATMRYDVVKLVTTPTAQFVVSTPGSG
jgi:hypothetical protein